MVAPTRVKARYNGEVRRIKVEVKSYLESKCEILRLFGLSPETACDQISICLSDRQGRRLRSIEDDDDWGAAVAASAACTGGVVYIVLMATEGCYSPKSTHQDSSALRPRAASDDLLDCQRGTSTSGSPCPSSPPLTVSVTPRAALAGMLARKGALSCTDSSDTESIMKEHDDRRGGASTATARKARKDFRTQLRGLECLECPMPMTKEHPLARRSSKEIVVDTPAPSPQPTSPTPEPSRTEEAPSSDVTSEVTSNTDSNLTVARALLERIMSLINGVLMTPVAQATLKSEASSLVPIVGAVLESAAMQHSQQQVATGAGAILERIMTLLDQLSRLNNASTRDGQGTSQQIGVTDLSALMPMLSGILESSILLQRNCPPAVEEEVIAPMEPAQSPVTPEMMERRGHPHHDINSVVIELCGGPDADIEVVCRRLDSLPDLTTPVNELVRMGYRSRRRVIRALVLAEGKVGTAVYLLTSNSPALRNV